MPEYLLYPTIISQLCSRIIARSGLGASTQEKHHAREQQRELQEVSRVNIVKQKLAREFPITGEKKESHSSAWTFSQCQHPTVSNPLPTFGTFGSGSPSICLFLGNQPLFPAQPGSAPILDPGDLNPHLSPLALNPRSHCRAAIFFLLRLLSTSNVHIPLARWAIQTG